MAAQLTGPTQGARGAAGAGGAAAASTCRERRLKAASCRSEVQALGSKGRADPGRLDSSGDLRDTQGSTAANGGPPSESSNVRRRQRHTADGSSADANTSHQLINPIVDF